MWAREERSAKHTQALKCGFLAVGTHEQRDHPAVDTHLHAASTRCFAWAWALAEPRLRVGRGDIGRPHASRETRVTSRPAAHGRRSLGRGSSRAKRDGRGSRVARGSQALLTCGESRLGRQGPERRDASATGAAGGVVRAGWSKGLPRLPLTAANATRAISHAGQARWRGGTHARRRGPRHAVQRAQLLLQAILGAAQGVGRRKLGGLTPALVLKVQRVLRRALHLQPEREKRRPAPRAR